MAILALPVALALGALADLAGGAASRLARGPGPWSRPATVPLDEGRRLLRGRSPRARPAAAEALGAVAALAGSGLTAGAALGLLPGTAPLPYLALALGVAGLRLAEPVLGPVQRVGDGRGAPLFAAVEAAFALSIGALFLRWGAFDVEAVRATQTVLGPGVAVGPAAGAGAVIAGAAAALTASALRIGPPVPPVIRRGRQVRRAGPRILVTLGRWAVAGASALLVATLVAGHRLDLSVDTVPFFGAVVVAATAVGAGSAVLSRLPVAVRTVVAAGAVVVGVGAVVLAAIG
jgi:hypothetical protein